MHMEVTPHTIRLQQVCSRKKQQARLDCEPAALHSTATADHSHHSVAESSERKHERTVYADHIQLLAE